MQKTPLTNIDTVLSPIEESRGLPNEHYINDDVFEEEKHAVLFNNWSAIGYAKDIPNIGDAKPINFVGMPLLIIRDENNSINVFQNTCRHRGMILIDKPTKVSGVISCPYHSWCYKLNGELCATPMAGGVNSNSHKSINHAEFSLFEIRSYVWRDIIFVNISNSAPEFVDYASKIIKRWKEFEQPIYYGGDNSSFSLKVDTNWKLAVENYAESYHLPFVHPKLNRVSKIEDHYHIEEKGKFSGQGSIVYTQLKDDSGEVFPDFENLSPKWDTGSEYICFYPNVLLGVHRDHIYNIILEPISTSKTIEHVSIYYAKNSNELPKLNYLKKKNSSFWESVFIEDVGVVEGMQKGRKGIHFDGGKFSPVMDSPTYTFHNWVASQINNYRNISL
jgi:phenylpropionate dioxygenase-like ring-hydroxylating dioxygenase large terminal subunit